MIDNLGMPQAPAGLVGITDSSTLYVRRNDGKDFDYVRIMFADSFSSTKNVVVFDETASFASGK